MLAAAIIGAIVAIAILAGLVWDIWKAARNQ
jgi:hypothetical protein